MRAVSAAAVAALWLAGGAAEPAGSAAAGAACKVTFTGQSRIFWGEEHLSATVWRGRYEGPASAEFGAIDDDGVLTLAILVAHWQADGRAQANLTGPVTLAKAELELALRAAVIGTAYQASLLRAGEGNADEIAEWEERQETNRALAAELRRLIAAAGPKGASAPKSFIRDRIGLYLERFVPGAPKQLKVHYVDPSDPEVQSPFCDPAAPNALVGKILCGRNFATGALRPANACPGGVAFTGLLTAPVCNRAETGEAGCPAQDVRAGKPAARKG